MDPRERGHVHGRVPGPRGVDRDRGRLRPRGCPPFRRAEERGSRRGAGRTVELEDPPWTARTALLRDHWVLEAKLVERAPGRGAGVHRIRLGWNGELAAEIYAEGQNASRPLGVLVRSDVGDSIERSNVYAFEIARVP